MQLLYTVVWLIPISEHIPEALVSCANSEIVVTKTQYYFHSDFI